MNKSERQYISLVLLHVVIAAAIFFIPFLSKIYAVVIVLFGFYYVISNKNRSNEVLYVSGYLIGVEVFLRMTGGNLNNEYIKVVVSLLMLLGFIFSGFSKRSFVYWLYLLLLIPGVLVTMLYEDATLEVRKAIVFNISGPICLGLCAIYCYQRRLNYQQLQNIIVIIGLPVISTLTYLVLYNPSVQDVITGTQSNFETSGGFGPNQVSTILGLGMFVFFCQLVFMSKTKLLIAVNGLLFIVVSYRALVTFSRGGVMTGIGMIAVALFAAYLFGNSKGRSKLKWIFLFTMGLIFSIWSYSIIQTGGLIVKRYANEDAAGRVKKDRLGGREEVMNNELQLFSDNPMFGVGVGLGKSYREKMIGQEVASHNEITRLLSEQGMFGVAVLLILLFTPFLFYFNNYQNIYFFSFFIFWLLTINHAAMRTAAPAFIYALCLLQIDLKRSSSLHNKLEEESKAGI
ncbi:O-antigen ligase family protein [Flavobacterium sp. TMP13]|uniref:O-antigen ligase family protein n=1 Tax=Flavobacterium sp. TMP13 TaxID=3425950 RepID=UPI003D76A78E